MYSPILHDTEYSSGSSGKAEAADGGGYNLVVTATGTEEISEFTVLAAEAVGGLMTLEAAHTSVPALDAAMIPFEAVVQGSAGPMSDGLAHYSAERPRIGAMSIRRHPLRAVAHGCPGQAEEGLGCLHVPVLAQHGVDQVPVPVDCPIQVAPATPDL